MRPLKALLARLMLVASCSLVRNPGRRRVRSLLDRSRVDRRMRRETKLGRAPRRRLFEMARDLGKAGVHAGQGEQSEVGGGGGGGGGGHGCGCLPADKARLQPTQFDPAARGQHGSGRASLQRGQGAQGLQALQATVVAEVKLAAGQGLGVGGGWGRGGRRQERIPRCCDDRSSLSEDLFEEPVHDASRT
jgi:hypothetical protein